MSDREGTATFVKLLAPRRGEAILDLGCGSGGAMELALRSGVRGVVGLDSHAGQVAVARRRLSRYVKRGVAEVRLGDAGEQLPFPSRSFHAVISAEFMECLPESKQKPVLREIHRVLKPGGRVLLEHTDWDTQVWNATDRALERSLVHAFCDWKQAWMGSADGWMGRKLLGLVRRARKFKDITATVHVLVNDRYTRGTFGYQRSRDLLELAKHVRAVRSTDVRLFLSDLRRLDRAGAYFYSINKYAVMAWKK